MSVVLPAPLVPTMATISPERAQKLTRRSTGPSPSAYWKPTSRYSISRFMRGRSTALGASGTSRCVSRTSKIRVPAAKAPWRVALTRESRLMGVYIAKSAATKDVNAPVVSRPVRIAWLP